CGGAQPFADRGAVHRDPRQIAAAVAQCRLPWARRAAVRDPQERRRRHRPDDPDAEPRQGFGQEARQRRRRGADARPRRFGGRPVAAERGVPRLLHRDQCAPAARRHHHRRSDQFHDARRGAHFERRHAARLGAAVGAVAQDRAEGTHVMFKLSVADLDSPSYFVAVAAAELGCFKQEGIDVELLREFGAKTGPERLREGTLHFFGGPAYAATRAFPGWKGAKLLCALSQYSYWFLAVRADLDVKRGDLSALKGLRISSSMEWPVLGLRHLLAESGLNVAQGEVQIVPAPPTQAGRFMGHAGVEAIRQNLADG